MTANQIAPRENAVGAAPVFTVTRPLKFGDCDPSGIAYFPSYLDLMVQTVEDLFDAVGMPWKTLIAERRIGTPTVKLDVTFQKPGFHGDLLEFSIRIVRIGNSSMDLEHDVRSRGEMLWKASQRLVATSLKNHKACKWPDDIRAAMSAYLEKDNA